MKQNLKALTMERRLAADRLAQNPEAIEEKTTAPAPKKKMNQPQRREKSLVAA